MKTYLPVFLFVVMLIGFGCTIRVQEPPVYEDYPPVYSEEEPTIIVEPEYRPREINTNFSARIDAARSITSFSSRDSALSSIAIDAANVLDIENTIRALSMITSFSSRDSTADKCATPFINESMIEEARNIANKITSFSTRDRVLARISMGPQ